jgi:hypothetical protein
MWRNNHAPAYTMTTNSTATTISIAKLRKKDDFSGGGGGGNRRGAAGSIRAYCRSSIGGAGEMSADLPSFFAEKNDCGGGGGGGSSAMGVHPRNGYSISQRRGES